MHEAKRGNNLLRLLMYSLWLTLTANFHQSHASISYIVRVELLHHQHFIDATLALREKSNNNQINKYEFLIEPNRCFDDRVHTAHIKQSMKSHSKINLYASNASSDKMLSCIEYDSNQINCRIITYVSICNHSALIIIIV